MNENGGKTCLKCGHVTHEQDVACPACGAIYAKVEALLRQKASVDAPEPLPRPANAGRAINAEEQALRSAHMMYGLFLASFVLIFLIIGGAIIAQKNRGGPSEPWLDSHFAWMRDTFIRWLITVAAISGISVVLALGAFLSLLARSEITMIFLGGITVTCVVGILGLSGWLSYRVARGWVHLFRREAVSR